MLIITLFVTTYDETTITIVYIKREESLLHGQHHLSCMHIEVPVLFSYLARTQKEKATQ